MSLLALLLLLGVAICWITREGDRTARKVQAKEGYRAPGFTIEALDGGRGSGFLGSPGGGSDPVRSSTFSIDMQSSGAKGSGYGSTLW